MDGPVPADSPVYGPVPADSSVDGPVPANSPVDGPVPADSPVDGRSVDSPDDRDTPNITARQTTRAAPTYTAITNSENTR